MPPIKTAQWTSRRARNASTRATLSSDALRRGSTSQGGQHPIQTGQCSRHGEELGRAPTENATPTFATKCAGGNSQSYTSQHRYIVT
jgi:hypothetical protein